MKTGLKKKIVHTTHLLKFNDVSVDHIASIRSEEGNGRKKKHYILIRSPLWLKRLDKSLMLLEQIDSQLGGLFEHLKS